VLVRPVSDGGPGLLDALLSIQSGVLHHFTVCGPLGDPVEARVLEQNNRVIIESADACGIHLVSERDPMNATTRGVGELLIHAAQFGKPIVIGLGGSATVDGGAGMREALGNWGSRKSEIPITALADVRNPLLGKNGAARVFGPQKGATPQQIDELEVRLAKSIDPTYHNIEGAGAAGGLGAGLLMIGAQLVRGSDWVLRELGIDDLLVQTRVLITGEGRHDAQSSMGKITGELILRAESAGVPVVLVAGVEGGPTLTLDDVARLAHEGVAGLLAR
ncbi:MAG TPA: glycerate kinase, partial [Gemmatimonadaceae bacterium]|nr:glycerate kinase [Gemmatimonadaceae bacterium]